MKSLQVACAIIEHDGKVLVCQRSERMSLPFKWEFPGGKINEGETPEACLVREVREELGLTVAPGRTLRKANHSYVDFSVTLYPFICTIAAGTLVLYEHNTIKWLLPVELASLDWAAADLPVLAAYLELKGTK